jgi:putative ABC transport system ATP-binding protein
MSSVIQLEHVWKTYRTADVELHAVRDVSLQIEQGEFVAIVGASGSGKSTMMNILGCLDRPSQGHYFLDGTDVSTLDRDGLADIRNSKIGFVFQGFNLLTRTSAAENVELPMMYARKSIGSKEMRRRHRPSSTWSDSSPEGGPSPQPALGRTTAARRNREGPCQPAGIAPRG